MRMVIMAVGALLLLGGAGAGVYFYFFQQAEASTGEDAGEHKAEKKEVKHVDKSHYEFVELDPLILPIVDDSGVSQTVSMVIALEVYDNAAAGKVTKMAPKLKDAFIQDMYGVLYRHAAMKGGVIQVGAIKARLNKVSQEVMGEDVVSDVLLQVVQQRPI